MKLYSILARAQVLIWIIWPATAVATSVTLATSLASIPALAWGMVMLLATVSGLASLLNALKDAAPDRLKMFIAAHMVGSWLSGGIVFLVAESASVEDLMETVAIALGAYAGATLTKKASEALLKKIPGGS